MFVAAFISIICFIEVTVAQSNIIFNLGNFISQPYLHIDWIFYFDPLNASMLIPVYIISSCVQFYTISYMNNDPFINRFFCYLSFFTFSMTLLVSSTNYVLLFIGWELIGLASYLLVNFWFTRVPSNEAGLKAFLVNRVGDYALTFAIVFFIASFLDSDLTLLFTLANNLNSDFIILFLFLSIIGSIAKSAQFGLQTWLTYAMQGPTPISALIHAATLVTAGVYLIIRLSPLIEQSSEILQLLTIIGGLSALLGALGGLFENDIKKIIAQSTTSQLGYMVQACGLSSYHQALFHQINHAFFKAQLFLSAGAVIHSQVDEQDIRKFGSLNRMLPSSYSFIQLGSLSLCAFPFLTGFYSKDLILELSLEPFNYTSSICYLLGITAAFGSSQYSIRLLILTFYSTPNYSPSLNKLIHELDLLMFVPLLILSFGAAFIGYITNELFLDLNIFQNAIYISSEHYISMNNFNYSQYKLIPLLCIVQFIMVQPLYNTSSIQQKYTYKTAYSISNTINELNNLFNWIIFHLMKSGQYIYRYIDRGFLEILGPIGLTRFSHSISYNLELYNSAFLLHNVFYILLFIQIAFIIIQ